MGVFRLINGIVFYCVMPEMPEINSDSPVD